MPQRGKVAASTNRHANRLTLQAWIRARVPHSIVEDSSFAITGREHAQYERTKFARDMSGWTTRRTEGFAVCFIFGKALPS